MKRPPDASRASPKRIELGRRRSYRLPTPRRVVSLRKPEARSGRNSFQLSGWTVCGNIRGSQRGWLYCFSPSFSTFTKFFEAEQLPLIPFKGPVLSWLAYRSLTGRTFIDLDFVTKQENIPRATSLLKGAGFRAQFGPQEELAGRSGHAPGQYAFFSRILSCPSGTAYGTDTSVFPVPLDFDKMSRRFITVEIAGRKIRTFSVEDTLVMLCVHGTKHFWDRLAWIVDVAEPHHRTAGGLGRVPADCRRDEVHARAFAGTLSGARMVGGGVAPTRSGKSSTGRHCSLACGKGAGSVRGER